MEILSSQMDRYYSLVGIALAEGVSEAICNKKIVQLLGKIWVVS